MDFTIAERVCVHIARMQSGQYVDLLNRILDVPIGTILDYGKALRSEGLLRKAGHGPRGGVHLSSGDATNWLLALALDHRRGECIAENVRRVRGLYHNEPPIELPAGLTLGLTFFRAATAGEAIERLLDDIRTGRLTTWAANEPYKLDVAVESRGRFVSCALRRTQQRADAISSYRLPGFAKERCLVQRQVTLDCEVFEQIARKLGNCA